MPSSVLLTASHFAPCSSSVRDTSTAPCRYASAFTTGITSTLGPTASRIALKLAEICWREISTQDRYGFMNFRLAFETISHKHRSLRSSCRVSRHVTLRDAPSQPVLPLKG